MVSLGYTDMVCALRERGAREPGRTAFQFLGDRDDAVRSITYAELDRRAQTIGHRLRAAGAEGRPVLLVHPPSLDYIAALFGCWYAGAIAVPAYPPRSGRRDPRLRSIVADSGAVVALSTRDALDRLEARAHDDGTDAASDFADLRWMASDGDEDDHAGAPLPAPLPDPSPDAIALLQYTSGSTSAPRGVVLAHAHFVENVRAMAQRAQIASGDRVVSWLPPYHDMGLVTAILAPVLLGIEAVLMTPSAFVQRPHRWLKAIGDHGGTVSGAPNFAYELCVRRVTPAQKEALRLASWRLAFVGAERVRPDTLERFAAAFAPAGFRRDAVRPCYGLAEATLGVSLGAAGTPARVEVVDAAELGRGRVVPAASPSSHGPPSPDDTLRVTRPRPTVTVAGCGTPLPGCGVVVVDPETRTRRGDGEVGELWVHGPSVGRRYWSQTDDEASPVFRARLEGDAGDPATTYLRTGDVGFVRSGEVYVTGRSKDVIILAGMNHHPEDIEATVERCHGALRVAGGAAFSVDVDGEERLVVVHEVSKPGDVDAGAIAAAIRDAVATAYELAVHDVVLVAPGAVPRTSSGKVQRGACRALYASERLGAVARVPLLAAAGVAAPFEATETAERVRAIVADVLGVDEPRSGGDFFGAGGDSLSATQLVSRVREELGVELPLRAVFEARTPEALARVIDGLPRYEGRGAIARADREGPLALSFSQERMWFLHRLDPASAAYNVAGALAIEGPLDVASLERALGHVFARHEVLRSRYPTVDGEPRVVLAPAVHVTLRAVDLASDPDAETRAAALASALAATPFDVAGEPLVRVALYRTGPARHVLATSMHHLVTDAWSMGVLLREVVSLYGDLAAGKPMAPAEGDRAFDYFDYARWQRSELAIARERSTGDLEYWRRALAGVEPLALPIDRPREARRTTTGGFEPLALSGELLAAVRELGVARGATPFIVLLAAFAALLHRYTGQSDITVGVPVANRNRLESEGLVGTLVNTLAVRVQCDPDVSFDVLLQRVRDAALGAYAHQDLPFERLVSELQVERRPGESPLIQVMFDYQNAPMPSGRAGGLALRPVMVTRGAAQFDLSLMVLDTELGRLAGVEYAADLFDASTVRRLLGHFAALLASAVRDASQPVAALPMLSEPERAELLAWTNASFDVPAARETVPAMFERQALETPDAIAVSDEGGAFSYATLRSRASALAARLRSLGAAPGARIAVLLERSREVVVALLAVLETGAAYVPIDPRYPAPRVRFVLEDATAQIVITQQSLAGVLPADGGAAVVRVDDDEPLGPPARRSVPPPGPAATPALEQAAYVLYTSGSTGKPKGVVVPNGALSNFLASMRRAPGIVAGDRLLSVTTIAFDIAGLELWLPIVSGASVHVAPGDVVGDGPRLRALVERVRPTVMQATPATWRLLIESGWEGDPRLKVLCGGEALARDLADDLLARSGSLWNMYGPTETTIWSTIHEVTGGAGPIPIGAPIARTRVYVLDRRRALVPAGVAGEIYIGGDGVALGYFRRPELTRERFVADPYAPGSASAHETMYRTGDLGRLRADGVLEHLGRLDHQIKLRGFRIEPAEIEAALVETGLAREAVVVAREDRPGDARLVAYYVPAAQRTDGPAELRDTLRARLPAHLVPSAFVALTAVPRTPNGKLDRAALPAPDQEHAAAQSERLGPRDELEAALARIWSETLGVRSPGVRDDFFLLGGDSLLAVRLLARIEREHRIDVPLSTLLENPTIEALAGRIRVASEPSARRSVPPLAHLVTVQTGRSGPPLVCVHGAGGHVPNVRGIARHVGVDQPLYAMQARGVDGVSAPLDRIEDMALDYVKELRLREPRGPYFLSGYCGGGLVAFEMARMLQDLGEEVALLALIDTYRPGSVPDTGRARRFVRVTSSASPNGLVHRARAWVEREKSTTARQLAVDYHRLRREPVPHELRDFWLTRSFLRTAAGYRPGVFRGRLTVLRAAEAHPLLVGATRELGWNGFASDGVDVFEIPGSHDTLAKEPHVAVLGATLRARLVAAMHKARRRG